MLKLLHLTYGKKYHVEDGMIKLLMMRADERHTYFNFVEEDFLLFNFSRLEVFGTWVNS